MLTTLTNRRTEAEPTGRQVCCECGRVIQEYEDRMRCCEDGCTKIMCIHCFDLSPICFFCHQHVCEDHWVSLADLGICRTCAGDHGLMAREAERFRVGVRAERERHRMRMEELIRRLDALSALQRKGVLA